MFYVDRDCCRKEHGPTTKFSEAFKERTGASMTKLAVDITHLDDRLKDHLDTSSPLWGRLKTLLSQHTYENDPVALKQLIKVGRCRK